MAVDSKHPDYSDRADEWAELRHCMRGAKAVKGEGAAYLPMPSGFTYQADNGASMYAAYLTRAQFPEILAPTIRGMVGVIHRVEADIQMPDTMGFLWEASTHDGLPLESLHKRITTELLVTGRFGLLADVGENGGNPYLSGYSAESLINWSHERDFFVLDEGGLVREGFEWSMRRRFRVLRLVEGRYEVEIYDGVDRINTIQPEYRQRLERIPFTVIGANELAVRPNEPPLIGVARAALAYYRLDADYRHQLFMSGQETLVIINGDAPEAVGAGVVLTLDAGENVTADAKYVGPSGTGIAAHRTAMQDERENAVAAGARMFDSKKSAESGEALRIRYAAQTATLTTVAQASAAGLEQGLRNIAVMMGLDPTEIIVKPSLDFADSALGAAEAAALVKVWQDGGISYATLYENLQRGEIASAERDFEEELALIDKEKQIDDPRETGVV